MSSKEYAQLLDRQGKNAPAADPAAEQKERTQGKKRQLEAAEQRALIRWAHLTHVYYQFPGTQKPERICIGDWLVASLNGAYLQGNKEQRRRRAHELKLQGMKAGAADLVLELPVHPHCGMKIEMKRRREDFESHSSIAHCVSAEQTGHLNSRRQAGWFTAVAFGWEDAAEKIATYFDQNLEIPSKC